jgi:hypothetical protein
MHANKQFAALRPWFFFLFHAKGIKTVRVIEAICFHLVICWMVMLNIIGTLLSIFKIAARTAMSSCNLFGITDTC